MTKEERERINKYMYDYSQGDNAAFVAFCQQYYRYFYTYVRSRIKDEYTAQDLTQDIFFKIQQMNFSNVKFENMSAYLYQLAKNLINNYFVKMERKREVELLEEILHYDEYEGLSFMELTQGLTKEELEILKLKYLHGYDLKYISAEIGLSVNTVLRRLKTLKKKVKKNQRILLLNIILLLIVVVLSI